MLRLTLDGLHDRSTWEEIGALLPHFDIQNMRKHTQAHPVWVHFGAGNIFRGYIARLQQELLNEDAAQSGIIVAETYDYEIIDRIYVPHDNLALLVSLDPDGNTEKTVIASIAKAVCIRPEEPAQMAFLNDVFENPALQLVSFTITEKGYSFIDIQGELLPTAAADMQNGPEQARHITGCVTALTLRRYLADAYPFALLSLDNCSHNGERLRTAMLKMANAWHEKGFVDAGFVAYLQDEDRVSFPFSMIDKITPRPSDIIAAQLIELGLEKAAPVVTEKNTFIAPFVNAEVPEYLVIEDRFPNGRPALERTGVYFTDRDTVNKTEKMKVTACLNPLHTALAVYGCLLGYSSIAAQMRDPDLVRLAETIGYSESLPVVNHPGILEPKIYLQEVLEKRLPNPYIPDTPQRIATDTSQKIPIRFGETIKAYLADEKQGANSLTAIPLAIAGWLRYLLGTNDLLEPMPLSSDPVLGELTASLHGIVAGKPETYHGELKSILKNSVLFAVDLFQAGLGNKIEEMFVAQLTGKGAVRAALKKYLGTCY
ncbi:MAG: mannitol dehydrogenase family protein [Actinomycetota bacterium]|nr:mannitol dehydrogenase family protein [Actinomycetota bacterium]